MDLETVDLINSLTDVSEFLELAANDPLAAAVKVEAWAAQLQELAASLRALADPGCPQDSGGMTERVMMRVVGPDGVQKQYVDTKGN